MKDDATYHTEVEEKEKFEVAVPYIVLGSYSISHWKDTALLSYCPVSSLSLLLAFRFPLRVVKKAVLSYAISTKLTRSS